MARRIGNGILICGFGIADQLGASRAIAKYVGLHHSVYWLLGQGGGKCAKQDLTTTSTFSEESIGQMSRDQYITIESTATVVPLMLVVRCR